MTTQVYKPGFYSVNGVTMYYDGITWYNTDSQGRITTATQLDALANPVATWAEPSFFPGDTVYVEYSFIHSGPAPSPVNPAIFVAIGHMVLATFVMDYSTTVTDTNVTIGNDSAAQKTYTGKVSFVIPTSFAASAPYEYSIYFTMTGATSQTYDKAFKTLAPGFTNLTITGVTKV